MNDNVEIEVADVVDESEKPVGPKVSEEDIHSKIVGAQYWNPEGTTFTVCLLLLVNGTIVSGESACVSPENFDAEIGKQNSYQNAVDKIWALEGYLLKERLTRLPIGRAGDPKPEVEQYSAEEGGEVPQ